MLKNNQGKCTIVAYHYVRDVEKTDYSAIKALSVKDFSCQIDYMCKNYSVIKLEDYISLLKLKKIIPENACILTFDDGFKDHYKNVFPILKNKKISATFFPQTQSLVDSIVPAVHKAHFLLAKLGAQKFSEEINLLLNQRFSKYAEIFFIDGKTKKDPRYRWDDNLSANLKWVIFAMPSEIKNQILNIIFSKYFENEKEFCNDLYMNFDQMREMVKEGMSFGSHSVTHPAISKLSAVEQRKEIKNSKAILEEELGTKIIAFSYPYGDFTEETINILKEEEYGCALTSKPAINVGKNIDFFNLNRLDTNDLPHA